MTSARTYSYQTERDYYSRQWPESAQPYRHLDPYLRCWMDPEGVFAGKHVLDIGAGECAYSQLIADRYRPRRVTACELFPERMRQSAGACTLPNLDFISGDCFRLPVRSGSIDVVFGSLILHQLLELDRIAAEVARVLVAGGIYVGIEPNPYDLKHLYRYALGRHSGNQFLFRTEDLAAFTNVGLRPTVRYFWARISWLRGPLFTTCMGITARKK